MTKKEGNSKSSCGVVLFVRHPELGKVKSRIAATEGEDRALEIYKQLLTHTYNILSGVKADIFVFYADEIINQDLWTEIADYKYTQIDGDLGARMTNALSIVLEKCHEVIIIGSDCAQIRTRHLEDAFQQLEGNDLVIGPTYDGGYYLLGMKEIHIRLFQNILWSTDEVLNRTIATGHELKLSVSQLETLSDIDYIEDWEKFGEDYIIEY